mgnify:CR=1 FL=1
MEMKSAIFGSVCLLSVSGLQADILSNFSPYLSFSRPDYDPAVFKNDTSDMGPQYAPFSPADSDLGVQQILSSYDGLPPVQFQFRNSLSYTDNAPDFDPRTSDSGWLWSGLVDVSWMPMLANGWYVDAGLSQSVFRYEGSIPSDFENFEARLGLVKSLPDLDDLQFFVRFEYQRLTSDQISESNYLASRIRTGLRKTIFLRPRYQLSAGIDAAFDISAEVDRRERDFYTADVKYSYLLTDKTSLSVFWSGSYWNFRNTAREDWNHLFGCELLWMPTQHLTVFTNITYTHHDSNTILGFNDFEALQAGLGIGIHYSF